MKTGKKLLALLLAVVMTMSLLTVGAFAEDPFVRDAFGAAGFRQREHPGRSGRGTCG